MTNRKVQAAAEGMPSIEKTLTPTGNETASSNAFFSAGINSSALTGTSIVELHDLRDAFHTLYDVASALSCQPRFRSVGRAGHNDAGCTLDSLSDLLGEAVSAIGDEVRRRTPATSEEILLRAFTLAAQTVENSDNLPGLGFDATQAARAYAKALAVEAGR